MTPETIYAACAKVGAVLARMNQPSSWNGYAVLAAGFGISNAAWTRDSVILAAVCALIGVIRNDGSTPPADGDTAAPAA